MAAAAGPATPQRPLPGGYIATPAPAPTIFAANAASLRQNIQSAPTDTQNATSTVTQNITPVERAARTINETLTQEARFPELESYITQGISGEYEMPSNAAWMPFQKLKSHAIPQKLLEQSGLSDVTSCLGIFAPLGHAWMALDNCLYLWDYAITNPELIGWEENSNTITHVKLVTPKPGVFVQDIQHLIVVTTTVEMILIGVAAQSSPNGAKSVALYNTRMSIPVKNLGVDCIEASKATGRIFFSGTSSDDIYEFQYQQDEGWFRGRTQRICHTQNQLAFVHENVKTVRQLFGTTQSKKLYIQFVIDDTRKLLYTLSNASEIKVWLIRDNELLQGISRPLRSLLQSTAHFSPQSELLHGSNVTIASLSVIPSTEATKMSLLATTNTGCRLYIAVTRNYGESVDAGRPPHNMSVLHIRFPPRDPHSAPTASPQQSSSSAYGNPASNIDYATRMLSGISGASRLPPGYFTAYMPNYNDLGHDKLFCSAPDFARLKNPQDTSQVNQRFAESGMFIELSADVAQIVPVTAGNYSAASTPLGFGNELAIQFDRSSMEIAVVTSNSIEIIRRRRLVDIFAGVMRSGSSDDEGRDGDIKRFVRIFGRGETAATALAVACNQGMDVSSDSRLSSVTDPEVIKSAKNAFINYGGKADYNANAVTDNSGSQLDSVRPSPRHEGLALYISRLVRDLWRAPIVKADNKVGEPPKSSSTIGIETLRRVQQDLTTLSKFLENTKNDIEGLGGPQSKTKAQSRQDEIAVQGEHRAMDSLVKLVLSIIEGISFVIVLFENGVDEVLAALGEDSHRRARELTYEALFVSSVGRDLAKELVKAIVNRNIANGSNVETVAEQLRRRCGSFCSADDVTIFKAQEQVKRASEAGGQSETGRVLLNESLNSFKRVAESLSMEHLHWAVQQYVAMDFFAGAIQLCLAVAGEKDRAKRALGWLKDGQPDGDPRREAFDARKQCYDLVFSTINELDKRTSGASETMDGQYTVAAKRRNEAYNIVNSSEDIVFQTCLFDWYVGSGESDRLLEIHTQHVVDYLKRTSQEDRQHADILWRYYALHNDYLQAASVQLLLAQGYFELSLEERIEYLSRARTNASTRQTALMDSRQSKQQLLREISDLLDVANIQDDILQRMKSEPRLTGQRRQEVLSKLNGRILPLDELFNQYADQASYYDICLLIYQVADHRNPADIKASWQSLITQTDDQAQALYGRRALPWETVGEKVRDLGRKLNVADATFPIQTLMPMLEKYFMEPRTSAKPPPTWVPDLFLDLDIPHETLLPVMEQMYYSNEHPFQGNKRKVLAAQMVYLMDSWFKASERKGERVPFGSEENASLVLDAASSLLRGGDLDAAAAKDAEELNARIQLAMR